MDTLTTETADETPHILELLHVIKRREQGGVAFELHVPAMRLARGQFAAIVGDSGCGKSTLLDMLALVSQPSQCEAFRYFFPADEDTLTATDINQLWQNQDERQLAQLRQQRLGYVLQTGGLLPFLTVLQNIQLPQKINHQDNPAYIKTLTDRLDITHLLSKKPQFLSGGQRQRAAILRALSHHPAVIIADEPTAAVDKKRAQAIVNDFGNLAKDSDTTIIMVTHDRDLVAERADVTFSFAIETVSETLTRSQLYSVNAA